MRITARQIRQIIREELSRLQETRHDDDMEFYSGEEGGEEEEEGSGYEYLRKMPSTIDWVDGPVDEAWLHKILGFYKKNFPARMWSHLARDFEVMLSGEPFDPDVVENYRNPDGTGIVSRQTVEALISALHGGR